MRTLFALALALAAHPAHAAPRRLALFGGGDRPKAALERFVAWSGGRQARILAVTWAGDDPEDYFQELKRDLLPFSPAAVEHAASTATLTQSSASFLAQLSSATGVLFTGGDQNRIAMMIKDRPEVLEALRARYKQGVPIAGISAGAAAASELMLTGVGDFDVIDAAKVGVGRGMGLLPDAIVDQHFIARQRENRLFALVLAHPDHLGIGIDKDGALLVEDERDAEAVGPGQTMLVRPGGAAGRLVIELLKGGDRRDLKKAK
jgi:cyanophycinase